MIPNWIIMVPTLKAAGFGRESTRSTPCATRCSWLGFCGRKQAAPVSLMKRIKPVPRRFCRCSRRSKITASRRIISADTLTHDGRGEPVAVTGMTWSGFRPSDDACVYGYLIPSNMFAVVTLGYTAEIMRTVFGDEALALRAEKLAAEIRAGIEKYGVVEHPQFGRMYAYETDGMGHYTFMDDANVPSLMSIPYLGYCSADDETYKNTRAYVLSKENPYYYEGTAAKGIGSPHTPENYIWHIALSMQGLTSTSVDECKELLHMLTTCDADTGFMHEGFHKDDPAQFTRPWFAWSNSLFSEFVLKCLDEGVL